METIRVLEKTGKDGTLNLSIPLGQPNVECEVVVTIQPPTDDRGWPPGYFDLAGSITDETFVRQAAPVDAPGAGDGRRGVSVELD